MSQKFVDEVEEMLRKLRIGDREFTAEVVLDQLNQAFLSFFEDFRLLDEEEREHEPNRNGYIAAQQVYHSAGLQIIEQIGAQMTPANERMETEGEEQASVPPTQAQMPVEIDPDLLVVNSPSAANLPGEDSSANERPPTYAEAVGASNSGNVVLQSPRAASRIVVIHEAPQPSTSAQAMGNEQAKGAIPKQRKVLVAAVGEDCSDWEEDNTWADINSLPYLQYERLVRPFFELPQMNEPSAAMIDRIFHAITAVQVNASNMRLSIEQIRKMLISFIQSRMDEMSRQIWLFQLEGEPSLDDLMNFLVKRSNLLKAQNRHLQNVAQQRQEQRERALAAPPAANQGAAAALPAPKKKRQVCGYCGQNHLLHRCELFRKLTIAEKKKALKRYGLCENCFSQSHKTEDCPQGVCRRCSLRHNSLLCPKLDSNEQ